MKTYASFCRHENWIFKPDLIYVFQWNFDCNLRSMNKKFEFKVTNVANFAYEE